jgi:aminoglycoside phosphotransferase (APT) family kinase protein
VPSRPAAGVPRPAAGVPRPAAGVPRPAAGVAQLAGVARAAVGRELVTVERLAGGSKKGVYRLGFGDSSAIAYVWSAAENYWPDRDAPEDVFADASGLDLFTAAHDRLVGAGVRVPRLLWADDSGAAYPADVAVVEDVRGGTLEPVPGRTALTGLREALAAMRAAGTDRIGKVARPDTSGRSCARIVLDTALRDLAEAADREPLLAAARSAVDHALHAAAAEIGPRTAYGLVHGELGPDHVLLDDAGRPVLIDIEGLASFDAEWEHAFLEMRFHEHYEALRLPGLDPARLRLYRLARHLSLVAGPLRLLDGDFPGRAFMLEIAATHTERVLAYLS